jgi:hypothetical protein
MMAYETTLAHYLNILMEEKGGWSWKEHLGPVYLVEKSKKIKQQIDGNDLKKMDRQTMTLHVLFNNSLDIRPLVVILIIFFL